MESAVQAEFGELASRVGLQWPKPKGKRVGRPSRQELCHLELYKVIEQRDFHLVLALLDEC
eukprot:1655474-Amphidinium_carterae.1